MSATMVSKEEFWPLVLEAGAIGELTTGDAVFDRRARCVFRVLESSLIAAEDVAQVECWEDVLAMAPAAGLGLVERKAAVLCRLCADLPFTAPLLPGRLRLLLGEGNFSVTQGDDRVTVAVALGTTEAQVEEVEKLVGCMLPGDLQVEMEWADGVPVDYMHVDYLETTNANDSQFITTDVLPTGETSCRIRTAFVNEKLAHVCYAFRAIPTTQSSEAERFYMLAGSSSGAYAVLRYGESSTPYSSSAPPPKVGVWRVLENRRNELWINGELRGTLPDASFVCDTPLHLFIGNAYKPLGRECIRCSGFEAWEGDAKIANYVPVFRRSDRTPGFFDTVSGKFKSNMGSGEFTYPGKEAVAATYSLRDRMYAQYTVDGLRRLHQVPAGYKGGKVEYAAEFGYKVLVEPPMPEVGTWAPVWHEREDCIELEWVEVDPPAEEQ